MVVRSRLYTGNPNLASATGLLLANRVDVIFAQLYAQHVALVVQLEHSQLAIAQIAVFALNLRIHWGEL